MLDEIRKLSKDFKNFKDKIGDKMTSEAKAASTSSTPPNEQDVQFLSDGYDDLVKSAKGVTEKFKKKLERRLNAFEFCVSNITKAIDNIFVYSYQYNIKITSDRETSEETANFCLMMFAGMGVDILISDIDIAQGFKRGSLVLVASCSFGLCLIMVAHVLAYQIEAKLYRFRPVYAGELLSIASPSSLVPIIILELNNAGTVCIIVES